MTTDFDGFDLDQQTESNWLARAAWLLLRLFIFGFSAATTAAFFYTYTPRVFAPLVGAELSPYLAAAAGFIALDLGALTWGYLRGKHADTVPQMAIAATMGVVNLALSVMVTAVYLGLSVDLHSGAYDAAGNLSTLGQALNLGGLVIIIVAVSGNFVAGYVYGQMGAEMRQATQARQLAAQRLAGRFAADAARTRLVTEQTLATIGRQLPALAQRQASSAGRAYLEHTMRFAPGESANVVELHGVNGNGGEPVGDSFRGGQ